MFKQVKQMDITENGIYAAKDKLRTAGFHRPDDLQTLDTRDQTATLNMTKTTINKQQYRSANPRTRASVPTKQGKKFHLDLN